MASDSGVPFMMDGETLRLVNEEQGYRYRERQRYLQEDDRVTIIRRIDEGERQSVLAREFGVTRAAICNTYKNREEILGRSRHVYDAQCAAVAAEGIVDCGQIAGDTGGVTRDGELATKRKRWRDTSEGEQEAGIKKGTEAEIWATRRRSLLQEMGFRRTQLHVEQAQRRPYDESIREPLVRLSAEVPRMQQLLSTHAVRLVAKLRETNTSVADFRRNAGMLTRLLVEKALVITSPSSNTASNSSSNAIFVGIGDGAYPMLRKYQELFPDNAVGIFHFKQAKNHVQFVDASLPSGIRSASSIILVTSECATGRVVCCAVKELIALAIHESAITLVSIFASKQGLAHVQREYPAIRGLVAAIDNQVDAMGRIQPGCGGFLDRYYDVDFLNEESSRQNI